MDPLNLRNTVWFIETAHSDENVAIHPVKGGGLCIDPTGLILTVSHVVELTNVHQDNCSISARSSQDDDLFARKIKLVEKFPHFDLALLQVVNESESEAEVFDFVPVGDVVRAVCDERIFGYVHQNDLLYSKKSGLVTFDFPENVNLPSITDTLTMKTSGFLINNPTFLRDQDYRTVACMTEPSDVAFHDLHPHLPLVEISGFGDQPGASGCPLFKSCSGELVGIISSQKHCHHFVIPVNFCRIFVDHVRSTYKI